MKLFTLVLCCVISTASAQPSTEYNTSRTVMKEVLDTASRSFSTLQKIVTEQNFKTMGFESVAEVTSATLGQPIHVYMVQLDDLRAYKQGIDPNTLLKSLNKEIFPVLVNEQVRSSVIVEKVREKWNVTSFGAPKLIKLLSKAQKDISGVTGTPLNSYFAVHVAALNAYYIGHRAEDNKLTLTTIFDDSTLKLPAGKSIPAEDAFAALVPIAKQYNGLPI